MYTRTQFYILCICSILLYVAHGIAYTRIADYYWRPYNGTIPADAIQGGFISGNVTYIGQIIIPGHSGIMPATIFPGVKAARGTLHVPIESDKYVTILCAGHNNYFAWINASTTYFPSSLPLVVGGFYNNSTTYIGRAFYKNDLLVGKVFDTNYYYKGLLVPTPYGHEKHFNSFEVLVYY